MFRFTMRELVLVTAIAALTVGWWLSNGELMKERMQHRELQERHSALVFVLENTWKMKVEYTPTALVVEDANGISTSLLRPWSAGVTEHCKGGRN